MATGKRTPSTSIHHEFINRWAVEFKAFFGFDYLFAGGRDGNAVKRLIALGVPVETMLDLAKYAWSKVDRFPFKNSATISGFAFAFNDIRVQHRRATQPEPEKPSIPPWKRLEILKRKKASHPCNPASINNVMGTKYSPEQLEEYQRICQAINQLEGDQI